ncbi:hypothetical protein ACI2KS_20110 [Pseudomonas sp. NPDC087358]|uniref:hypothetical protein n=1 Tax=Pseudomonas sp. NPDC087358 TaxID=3364439 RepID=UPI00384AC28C
MTTPNEGFGGAEQRTPPPGDALHHLQDDARALFDSAREQGAEHLESYRESAADQIENLARSATSAAEQLQDQDTLGLSHYITDVADSLGTFAGSLRGKSADELLQQVGRLARDNPALFVTGSIALGFGLSRFLRASAPDLTSAGATDATDASRRAPSEDEFDPRIAADEELAIRPEHEGDVVHGTPGQSSTPQSPGFSGATTADANPGAGIRPSGAEMGSFGSADAQPSSRPEAPAVTPDNPPAKGAF